MGLTKSHSRMIEGASVNVKDFGAVGDGVTDDRAAIQAALDSSRNVYIPEGNYALDMDAAVATTAYKGIEINQDNTTLTFAADAKLSVLTNSVTRYWMIRINLVDNVKVIGATLDGRRDLCLVPGEASHAISVHSSTNVILEDCTGINCNGDGLTLGSWDVATASDHITVRNCLFDNNRRQGMSITFATNINCYHSIFSNTNGTAPECGVDVETNAGNTNSKIAFYDCAFTDNNAEGLRLDESNTLLDSVIVDGCKFTNNALLLITSGAGSIRNVTATNNTFSGLLARVSVGRTDTLPAIDVEYVDVSHNYFKDAHKPIECGNADNISFVGNSATNSAYFCDFKQCSNVIFSDNLIDVCTTATTTLVYFNAVIDGLISGNIITNATGDGVTVTGVSTVKVSNNIIKSNAASGIYVLSHNTHVTDNIISLNGECGIECISKDNLFICDNYSHTNSQLTDITYDNILLYNCDTSTIQGNVCKIGVETNRPKYGIRLLIGTTNFASNNDLLNSGVTAAFQDAATGTITAAGNRVV